MSDCGACLYTDGERSDFCHRQNVKARKQYACEECNRPIVRGELYQYATIFQEGEWSSFRTCLVCAEIRAAFYCDGEMFGEFWPQMRDYAFNDMSSGCLNRLTTATAKKYLLERWNQWKETQ